jgi:protein-S-isoprenylcysteine O-methyltransferase Ste14
VRKVLLWGDVAFYATILAAAAALRPRTTTWKVALLVAALTFPFWIAARVQLGSAVSLWPRASHLVTSGLYSRLRHPVYVFGTIASLSALLALQIWPVFALGVALVPLTVLRARREEQVLSAAFGEEYQRYKARTWL